MCLWQLREKLVDINVLFHDEAYVVNVSALVSGGPNSLL
jgi:hypothetical protein